MSGMTFARACLLVVAVGCGSGGGFPDARPIDAPPPTGTFSLAWSLTNTNSQPITCDEIGGLTVTALLRNRDVQGGSTEVFTCGTLMGTSQALVPGIYDIDFELNGVSGLIATAPKQMGIVVTSGGNVQLAPVAFSVDATGGLKLNFTTGTAGGNCVATASNGAGITQTTITLTKLSTGACAPVTFTIAAGATQPASTYTVDCTTPVVGPCIEADQQLSVAGVASGTYVIHVRGTAGADCWKNDDQLPVPPVGHDLVRTLNLAIQMAAPSC